MDMVHLSEYLGSYLLIISSSAINYISNLLIMAAAPLTELTGNYPALKLSAILTI